jgi:lysophospholipase L1-like esterase
MKSLSFLALPLLLAVAGRAAAEQPAAKIRLGNKERIVFLGDSITQAGIGGSGYVTLIKKALAEKHPDAEIIGAGISGNKVPDLQKRLERDVLSKKPTLVVIYIGINDVWHGENDPAKGTSKENYEAGLRDVIKRIQDGGARVLLCTPSVIGEKTDGSNKNDARLDEYSDISRKVAKEMKVPVCDLRQAFLKELKTKNPDNKERGILTGDRVHLNDAGNKFVAEQILNMLD